MTSLCKFNIEPVECGSVLDGSGNACFWVSFIEGLHRVGHPIFTVCEGYNLFDKFVEIGMWSRTVRGRMIDTDRDSDNIELLAKGLGVRIVMAYEEETGIIAPEKNRLFGTIGPFIGILKVAGAAHFRAFFTDFCLLSMFDIDAQKRRLESLQTSELKSLVAVRKACQEAADMRLALALQDREHTQMATEAADMRLARAIAAGTA